MPRPQFTLRALLVAMLVVAAFFGGRAVGIREERERLGAEVAAEKERLKNQTAELRKDYRDLYRWVEDALDSLK